MGDVLGPRSATERTSSWAAAGSVKSPDGPLPRRALPPRRPWAAYVLIGALIIAMVVAGVLVAQHVGGSPLPDDTTSTSPSQGSTESGQPDPGHGYAPDILVPPVFGAPLPLMDWDTPQWTAIEDAQWKSIGLAYVRADAMSSGGSIVGIDLANNTILWTWDLTSAVDDSGDTIEAPAMVAFGEGFMELQEQTLFSGQSHNYFVPNGKGRFAVFIQTNQSDLIMEKYPTTVYVFSVDDGSVVSHTTSGFGPCNKPQYIDDVILPGAGWLDAQLGAVADTGGILWTSDFPTTREDGSPRSGQWFFDNETVTVDDTWVRIYAGFADIHTGEPAAFGHDIRLASPWPTYYSIGDALLRVSPRSELQLWDPETNTPVWDPATTIPSNNVVGGDDQTVFVYAGQRINGYSLKDGSLLWQSTAAPPNTGSILHVGNSYLTPMSPGAVGQHWPSILSFTASAEMPPFCFGDYDQCQVLAGERVAISLGKEHLVRAFDMTRNRPTSDPLWTLQLSPASTISVVSGYLLMVSDHATISIGR